MTNPFRLIGGCWSKEKKRIDGITKKEITEIAFLGSIYINHFKYRIYISKNRNPSERCKAEYKIYHIRGINDSVNGGTFLK